MRWDHRPETRASVLHRLNRVRPKRIDARTTGHVSDLSSEWRGLDATQVAISTSFGPVSSRELRGDLNDALGLLAARRASEYPALVSKVPEIVIRIRASCQNGWLKPRLHRQLHASAFCRI